MLPLWSLRGGRRNRLSLPYIGELNLAAVERKIAFEDDVQRGTARKFRFRSTSQEHGSQSCGRPDPRANSKSLYAVGNRPDSRARSRGLRDRADVLSFAARAGDLAFGIHGLLTTGIGAARGSPQT